MDFSDLLPDTSYLQADAVRVDQAPWVTTDNPFERRMAMNLSLGTSIAAIDITTLGRVLGTASKLRRQAFTVDLSFSACGPIKATVAGVFSYFAEPENLDTAANFDLALTEVSKSRKCFFVSVTPENKFWIHSEHALAAGENDWAENMRSSHLQVSF
jgi:hypothetical protein